MVPRGVRGHEGMVLLARMKCRACYRMQDLLVVDVTYSAD